jgi:hypothetical protein
MTQALQTTVVESTKSDEKTCNSWCGRWKWTNRFYFFLFHWDY